MDARRKFGNDAEREAAQFLTRAGMKILEKQYRTKFGEIDLIALDGDEIVFVEVKARRSLKFGYPEESVTSRKLEKISHVAQMYLSKIRQEKPYRIDVIAIEYEGNDSKVLHIKGVS